MGIFQTQKKRFLIVSAFFLLLTLPIVVISTFQARDSRTRASELPVFNVKDFGVVGNGSVDDTAAINNAQMLIASTGGVLYFPAGTYLISGNGIVLRKSNIVFRGESKDLTILRRSATTGNILVTSASFPGLTNLTIENMTLDRNGRSFPGYHPTVVLYGSQLSGAKISNVIFWDSSSSNLALSGMNGVSVEGSQFLGRGDSAGAGVTMNNGTKNVEIRGSIFKYLIDGIIVGTLQGQYQSTGIVLDNSTFDLGWWLLKTKMSGEGATVSYTNNSLTDTAADFNPLSPLTTNTVNYNVRVMPLREQGNGQFTENMLMDSAAQFVTNGVIKGEIVRVENAFGVVDQVISETELKIESWVNNQEYVNTSPPQNGSSYSVYGIYLGKLSQLYGGLTTTTLKTQRWHDLHGNTVTPVNGTRYEVMVKRPNYPFHAEIGTSGTQITNNQFIRGWSDQISHYGERATVKGNIVKDGQDVGITIHGVNNVVSDNTISHQGTNGIWTFGDDNTFSNNIIADMAFENFVNTISMGCIVIEGGERNRIEGNQCKRNAASNPLGRYGYVIYAVNYATDSRYGDAVGNILKDNISEPHTVADYMIFGREGAIARNTILENNIGTVVDNGENTIRITPTPTLVPTATPTPMPTSIPTPTPTAVSVDKNPPIVSITSPKDRQKVTASILFRNRTYGRITRISATASDASGISKVEFYVNGALRCTDASKSYSCDWSVPTGSGIVYAILVKAYDKAGNVASHTIQVTSR